MRLSPKHHDWCRNKKRLKCWQTQKRDHMVTQGELSVSQGHVHPADVLLLNIFLHVHDKYILVISNPSLVASPSRGKKLGFSQEGWHGWPGTRDSRQRIEPGFTCKGFWEPYGGISQPWEAPAVEHSYSSPPCIPRAGSSGQLQQ